MMYSSNSRHITRINRVMLINIACLCLHLLLYSPVPSTLLAANNPFCTLVVTLAITAVIGIWLCADFMLPIYLEAKVSRIREVTRPAGTLMSLNILAMVGGGWFMLSHNIL